MKMLVLVLERFSKEKSMILSLGLVIEALKNLK
jgi:hypothetical protein